MNKQSRKILFIVSWVLLMVYLVGGLNFSTNRADEVICNSVRVVVRDSANYRFVTSAMIKKLMTEAGKMPIGVPITGINTKELEDNISQMVAVRNVQAYKLQNGVLQIDVKQRKPIVRIFNANNQSYYIDVEGRVMPTLSNFSAHVLVVSGNIREPFTPKVNVDVTRWNDSLYNGTEPLVCKILGLARYIERHKFWSSQIEQIYVDGPNDVCLIPTVGPHTIVLGEIDGYEKKLKKLMAFYTEALPYEGWNRYKSINLKYSNQIICTKR